MTYPLQGVLYVSHGSRVEAAKQEALKFIDLLKHQVDAPLQEGCFLEIAEPNIHTAVEKLAAEGATNIAVVPLLLLDAGHYYKDIPAELNEIKAEYPNLTFTYGKPLGVQDRLVDILAERMKEAKEPIHENARILLVGRGSRNPKTRRDMEEIGERLKAKTNISHLDICFLAALKPSFEQALAQLEKVDSQQVFIVPYLWFTGVLIQSMRKKVDELGERYVFCEYLGHHPFIQEAAVDRVQEALDTKGNL
ncbi:sirohydrochlorin chelatase [Halobacillus salinarum]|uniref:Sirohydrochlorin chelatase n=1 Tax=Halobacillus salinarum TaxID=2932257 RepID=A0ABY4EIP5_9BACI|nr:sirohydrochlorin chelatase [Halobacillus salinarum]UOQ44364.1 sirohydrochlorin chelatase [Halobacillus salinarum]